MAENTTVARPYAIAAFKQAQEEGNTAEWAEMLGLLVSVVEDATMKGLIANPKVKRDQLGDLVIEVCGDGLSETGRNFAKVLAHNGRLGELPAIADIYAAERARSEKRSEVVVRSAYKLSPAQENDINVAMTRRLGTKVDMTVEIDESLIGGVVIRAGDLVIDVSLRGRLNSLASAIS